MSIAYRTLIANKSISGGGVYILTTTRNVSPSGSAFDKFDTNGNIIATLGTNVLDRVKTDNIGNIYTSDAQFIRKYNKDFNLLWTVDYGNNGLKDIAVDKNGNVIAVGTVISGINITTKKYNSSGVLQWSVNHGNTVACVAVDSSNNIYTGGAISTFGGVSRTTRKYNQNGVLQWSVNHFTTVTAIGVDKNQNVIAGSTINSQLKRYNSSGTLSWIRTEETRSIETDINGNIYTIGVRSANFIGLRKYNSSGSLLFARQIDSTDNSGVTLDKFGNIYSVGIGGLFKYDLLGIQLWTKQTSINSGMLSLATFPPTSSQWQ
jgi:hypothetical protein